MSDEWLDFCDEEAGAAEVEEELGAVDTAVEHELVDDWEAELEAEGANAETAPAASADGARELEEPVAGDLHAEATADGADATSSGAAPAGDDAEDWALATTPASASSGCQPTARGGAAASSSGRPGVGARGAPNRLHTDDGLLARVTALNRRGLWPKGGGVNITALRALKALTATAASSILVALEVGSGQVADPSRYILSRARRASAHGAVDASEAHAAPAAGGGVKRAHWAEGPARRVAARWSGAAGASAGSAGSSAGAPAGGRGAAMGPAPAGQGGRGPPWRGAGEGPAAAAGGRSAAARSPAWTGPGGQSPPWRGVGRGTARPRSAAEAAPPVGKEGRLLVAARVQRMAARDVALSAEARSSLFRIDPAVALALLQVLDDRVDVLDPSAYLVRAIAQEEQKTRQSSADEAAQFEEELAEEGEQEEAAGPPALVNPALFKLRVGEFLKREEAKGKKGKGRGKGKDKGTASGKGKAKA